MWVITYIEMSACSSTKKSIEASRCLFGLQTGFTFSLISSFIVLFCKKYYWSVGTVN